MVLIDISIERRISFPLSHGFDKTLSLASLDILSQRPTDFIIIKIRLKTVGTFKAKLTEKGMIRNSNMGIEAYPISKKKLMGNGPFIEGGSIIDNPFPFLIIIDSFTNNMAMGLVRSSLHTKGQSHSIS